MNKCENCKVFLYDDTEICPLCHSVVTDLSDEESKVVIDTYGQPAPYPDVSEMSKRINFVMKLLLFIFILTEIAGVIINMLTTPDFLWCLLSLVGLTYVYLSMKYWLEHDSAFGAKVGLQIFLTLVLTIAINLVIGKPYWAFEWIIPGVIILGDITIFLIMLLYKESWYSYILLLILMGIFSVALWILYWVGLVESIILVIISTALTGIFMLGVAIFRDRDVKRELKRRFHV